MNQFQRTIQLVLNTLEEVEIKSTATNLNGMLATVQTLKQLQADLADVLIPAEMLSNEEVEGGNQNGT